MKFSVVGRFLRVVFAIGSLAAATISFSECASAHQKSDDGLTDFDDSPPPVREGEKTRPVLAPVEDSIRKFEARIERQPKDLFSYVVLGQLYLRQAKQQDDLPAYGKAEAVLRRALELQPANPGAKTALASALQAQHKFAEARELVAEVVEAEPKAQAARAILGDCQLELGDYEGAERTFAELVQRDPNAGSLARRARLLELKGRDAEARPLLEQAVAEAREAALPNETMAWFEWRIAIHGFRVGDLEAAERAYRAALALVADDVPSLAGLAALRAAQGEREEAIRLYQQAIDVRAEPPLLAAFGDLLARHGESDRAKELYDQAEAAMAEEAKVSGAAHFREVSLFFSSHDRHPERALELAERDLAARKDIYAYDALAWALLKNDRVEEAQRAIEQALQLGTRDSILFYHAGMIYHRAGNTDRARDYLRRALDLNPEFAPLAAEDARRVLGKLSKN